mgnify:CR=1 FL=1
MSRKNNEIFKKESTESLPEDFTNQQGNRSNLEWSVPVEAVPLPSKGVLYSDNSFFHKKELVNIKTMTAKEEDILLSTAYYKNGSVMSELIKSCIDKPGVDPDDLILGDKNALVISIRITGYGTDYNTKVTCPACGSSEEKVFNLSELEIKRLGADPIAPGINAFEYILPVSKKKVIFKLLMELVQTLLILLFK